MGIKKYYSHVGPSFSQYLMLSPLISDALWYSRRVTCRWTTAPLLAEPFSELLQEVKDQGP